MTIQLPEYLYHGTTINKLHKMKERLGNREYWKKGKDFGPGFYTTVNLGQAKRFAKMKCRPNDYPCVAKMKILDIDITKITSKVFIGASRDWSDFIFKYRIEKKSNSSYALIAGPLADNDMRDVVLECRTKDKEWFYRKITSTTTGEPKEYLGDQVVFTDETFINDFLIIEGWYLKNTKGEWRYETNKEGHSRTV
ncbi:DUF3990 domain-containing protein [Halalkalibacterium halodurans]|uniref:DUF3990 domain-containing protein n=1 Tax=Halalkalibacterium halodurans TaxID=86665 RepID=UPI002E23E458|nr:DUF3990 domain-containing protein [Halalkalibacterium halodurans]